MKILVISNGMPYGAERSYDGPRLAGALVEGARFSMLEEVIKWAIWGHKVVSS